MPSRTAQKRKRTKTVSDAVDPLERAMRSAGPRCQCDHGDGRCRRTATFRVSVICVEVGCRTAVHVYLACGICKVKWLQHSVNCFDCPELRVAPL
jgi:hypothetical protein